MLSNGEFFRDGEKRKEEAEMKKKKKVGELFRDIFKYNICKKALSLLLVLILSVGFVLSGNFDFSLTAEETGVSVRYYVAENNDWKLVQSKTTVAGKTTNWNGTGRLVITRRSRSSKRSTPPTASLPRISTARELFRIRIPTTPTVFGLTPRLPLSTANTAYR